LELLWELIHNVRVIFPGFNPWILFTKALNLNRPLAPYDGHLGGLHDLLSVLQEI
jgi:hypothetical protein